MSGRFLDNLVNRTQYQVEASVSGWLVGGPPEEVALLNRLNERLVRNRICKVRGISPGVVRTWSSTLHRKGSRGTDLYGCDLAVTFHVRHASFLKTVFFQLKRSQNGVATIEPKQVRAQRDGRGPEVGHRAARRLGGGRPPDRGPGDASFRRGESVGAPASFGGGSKPVPGAPETVVGLS